MVAWAEANAKFLYPGADARLEIDTDLQELRLGFDQPEFFDALVKLLGSSSVEQQRAQRLIQRYLPDASTSPTPAQWIQQNRPYLFASDVGDYRWYADELARRRGVPSSDLRGPKRADAATLSQAR
jgi:hypothetical protein